MDTNNYSWSLKNMQMQNPSSYEAKKKNLTIFMH